MDKGRVRLWFTRYLSEGPQARGAVGRARGHQRRAAAATHVKPRHRQRVHHPASPSPRTHLVTGCSAPGDALFLLLREEARGVGTTPCSRYDSGDTSDTGEMSNATLLNGSSGVLLYTGQRSGF
jgi:hypothetical protein